MSNLQKHFAFVWTIESWQTVSKVSQHKAIESEVFQAKDDSNNWILKLYPNGDMEKDYIVITLSHLLDNKIAEGTIKMSLLNHINRKVLSYQIVNTVMVANNRIEFPYFIDRYTEDENIKELLKEDKLVILCEITMKYIKTTVVEKPAMKPLMLEPCKNLKLTVEVDEFEKFLEDKTCSDVVFKIEDKEIHSHKIILLNKSPVFAAMFEHDMQENLKNQVEIVDANYYTFKEMLRFIYTGKVNEIKNVGLELIVLADKYCIDDLKNVCEAALSNNITLDNVISYLDIAVNCNTTVLKHHVNSFILANKKLVVNKPEFKALVERDSNLMMEVFQAMAI